VNHPDANERASSKLEQLRRAKSLGFDVPETVVTNDAAALRNFATAIGVPLICKPIRSGYVEFGGREQLFFTSLVADDAIDDFALHDPTPYLFQRMVEKQCEFRVTVIGERVFAVRLDSQSAPDSRVDWRRGDQTKLAHTPDSLPQEVENRCRAIVGNYGLAFGAIDLALDKEGRYVFFEINPNGQWAWLEQMTGIRLRAALADLLLGES
jgi:glutathione synthase/RimK-type ligase-like ATP-grasp enzyme